MHKRVLIATGGTGGHIHPAEALASQLQKDEPDVEILFAGKGLAGSPYFHGKSIACEEIPADGLQSRRPLALLRGLGTLGKGVYGSLRLLRRWKPDVVVGFGSYHSAPVLLAALLMRVPVILHEANSFPGKVVRHLSRWAKATGIHLPPAAKELNGKVVEVGMPLRSELQCAPARQEQARRYFGLDPHLPTFLAFGGSQGAFAINTLFCNALVDYLSKRTSSFQVLHLTGSSPLEENIRRTYEEAGIKAYIAPYQQRMDLAWQAATCVVSRAGACTVAEMIEMEVPGILIPYPHSSEQHQYHNATFVVHAVGGAVLCPEEVLTPSLLASEIASLLANEHERLQQMRTAIRKYKKERHHKELHTLVSETIGIKVR